MEPTPAASAASQLGHTAAPSPMLLNALWSMKRADDGSAAPAHEAVDDDLYPAGDPMHPAEFDEMMGEVMSVLNESEEEREEQGKRPIPTTGKYQHIFAKYDKVKKENRREILRRWDTWLHQQGVVTPLRRLYAPYVNERTADEVEYEVDSDESEEEREAAIRSERARAAFYERANAVRQRLRMLFMLMMHRRVLDRLNDTDVASLQHTMRASLASALATITAQQQALQDSDSVAAPPSPGGAPGTPPPVPRPPSRADLRKLLDRSPAGSRASSRAGSRAASPAVSRLASRSNSVVGTPPALPRPRTPSQSLPQPLEHPSPLLQHVLRRSPGPHTPPDRLPPPVAPLQLAAAEAPASSAPVPPTQTAAPPVTVTPPPLSHAAAPAAAVGSSSRPARGRITPSEPVTVLGEAELQAALRSPEAMDALWRTQVRRLSDTSSVSSEPGDHLALVQQRIAFLREASERAQAGAQQQAQQRAGQVAARMDRLRQMLGMPQ